MSPVNSYIYIFKPPKQVTRSDKTFFTCFPNSMSPYDSPAPYNLLQYTEIAEGIWYPRGGFHKVVEQLEKIASKKFDAKFVYNTGIKKIIVDDNNVAKGVQLDNGEEKFADIVVCNAGMDHEFFERFYITSFFITGLDK